MLWEICGRQKVQQDFIKVFIKTVLKPKNLLKLNKFMNIVLDGTEMNISLRDASRYIIDLRKLDMENIYSCSAEGSFPYINGVSYFELDKTKTRNIIKENFK